MSGRHCGIGNKNIAGQYAPLYQGFPQNSHGVAIRAAEVQNLGKVYRPFQAIARRRLKAGGVAAIVVCRGACLGRVRT
jgi:hypothetical protein